MKFKAGDKVRFNSLLYKQLGLRGGRKPAIVASIDPVNSTCHFDGDGLHGYFAVHQNNLEKVSSRKCKIAR